MGVTCVMAFYKVSKGYYSSLGYYLKLKGTCLKLLFCSRLCTTVNYKMKSAYFQNMQGDEKVQISISFDEFNVHRLLRFNRNISETLDDFLKRLEIKILELYSKKVVKKAFKSKTVEAPPNIPKLNLLFLVNNEHLPNDLSLREIFSDRFSTDLKLRIMESDYEVIVNCPMIQTLELPNSLRVGAIAYPEKFQAFSTNEDKSEFIWFKSLDLKSKAWERCGEGFFYNIQKEDSEHFLKLVCTPKYLSKVGPTCEVVSKETVKNFENTEMLERRHELTKNKTGAHEFRIVSYNVLADCYTQTKEAKSSIFTFCDPNILNFEYRKCLLNFELNGYNADIICLQEVERSFYKNELLLWLTALNYNCLFHEKEGAPEGCAFCYDPKKFRTLSTNSYNFTNELMNNPVFSDIKQKIETNETLKARLQNVLSLIQVVTLQSIAAPKEILVVGNTHFYFHPNACHIRLLQGILSCRILSMVATNISQQVGKKKKISVILCGDFNSTPETAFHQMLLNGHIGEDCPDWKSCEEETIKNLSFNHSLKMQSAYSTHEYTNFTPLFKGCLDYIYFENKYLEVKQTVPIPSEEVLGQYDGIPSKYFPSDHVALVADLKFKE